MAGSVIGALRVNLGLDSAQFERGARRSQSTLKTMRTQFTAIAGAAAAMGAAISAAALKGAQQIDEAAKSARRLDTSIGGFRALELAAGEAGVSLSGLTSDLQTMNRELANIGTSGNADRALERLGMSVSDLADVDADEKLAVIADRIKTLGLTSGETTAVLRDFGVRNREMVLLVGQGGDAIREARMDIESYGLAVSSVDSARIEAANDAIGRLGLIGQYAGQQLAIALVPAMGRLAEAMTNSLREGGLLRGMIDGLVGNLDRMATYVGVAVVGFGTRYVVALAAARVATMSLAGSLAVLRAALIRTGIGALVVGAGELVLWFGRLVERVGGVGNAFKVLVAQGKAAALSLKASFLDSVVAISSAFIGLTQDFARGMNSLFGTSLKGLDYAVLGSTKLNAEFTGIAGAALKADFAAREASDSAAALATTMETAAVEVGDTADSLDKIEEAAGGAGGGMRKAADDAMVLAAELDGPVASGIDSVANAFGDWLANGFKDFKSFTGSIIDGFKQMISRMIATAIANPIKLAITGGAASLAAPAASATGGSGGLLSGLLGSFGTAGGGILGGLGGGTGLLGGLGNSLSGGLGGLFGIGGNAAAAGGGIMASLGAALPVIGIAAGLFAAFKKKRTLLDSGLDVDVLGNAVAAQQFQTINTKRFFGLSNKTRTSYSAADPAIAQAVNDVQAGVAQAAASLDIGAEAFEGFSYSFNLSLKDMSSDQAAQAIAAEVSKLGDAFAGMIPHIQTVTELMAVTQERYALETRLLQLQGDTTALRARELEGVHHYNKALAEQIHALEDAIAAAARAAEIAQERYGLETRLLQVQGDTEALRAREIAQLHETNRAILQQIYSAEDAAAAQRELEQRMAEVNRQIEQFAANSNNFVSRQEQMFAQTSAGYREQAVQIENRDLLRQVLTAIREGDKNTARLLLEQIRREERKDLEQAA